MLKMGRLGVKLTEDLEDKFRTKAMRLYGKKRGYVDKGLINALQKWIND